MKETVRSNPPTPRKPLLKGTISRKREQHLHPGHDDAQLMRQFLEVAVQAFERVS